MKTETVNGVQVERVRPQIGLGVPGGGGGGGAVMPAAAAAGMRAKAAVESAIVKALARETALVLLRDSAESVRRVLGLEPADMAGVLAGLVDEYGTAEAVTDAPPG